MGVRRSKGEAFHCECGDHAWARLTKGYVTLVSPDKAEVLVEFPRSALVKPKHGMPYGSYPHDRICAVRSINGRGTIQLHRELTDAPSDMVVDHRSRNTLDNRDENLRVCSITENNGNSIKPTYNNKKLTSTYKGVCWDKSNRHWKANISHAGKNVNIGVYCSERDAAEAYMFAAMDYFKDYSRFTKEI